MRNNHRLIGQIIWLRGKCLQWLGSLFNLTDLNHKGAMETLEGRLVYHLAYEPARARHLVRTYDVQQMRETRDRMF